MYLNYTKCTLLSCWEGLMLRYDSLLKLLLKVILNQWLKVIYDKTITYCHFKWLNWKLRKVQLKQTICGFCHTPSFIYEQNISMTHTYHTHTHILTLTVTYKLNICFSEEFCHPLLWEAWDLSMAPDQELFQVATEKKMLIIYLALSF